MYIAGVAVYRAIYKQGTLVTPYKFGLIIAVNNIMSTKYIGSNSKGSAFKLLRSAYIKPLSY